MEPETTGGDSIRANVKKAGFFQVAATIFWGLFMIGRKGTWDRDGAIVSLGQVIVGAAVGGVLVVLSLIAIVILVLR